MSAATADINTPRRDGRQYSFPLAAAQIIYAGAIVALNASGYAVPAANTAGLKVVGRATEQVDNSGGAAGDLSVPVDAGVFGLSYSGLTIADIGKDVYISDDNTVAASGDVFAGKLVDLDDTYAWISIEPGAKAQYTDADVPAAANVAAVSAADAGTQTEAYVQADVQAIATLANANKAGINAILSALKTAGLMTADE